MEDDVGTADAERFIGVISRVLELDYLKPDLRRRVLKIRRRMIKEQDTRRHGE